MTQVELSATQRLILTTACQRQDRSVFPITAKIKGGAVGNVAKSLLKRGLLEEVPATDEDNVWRFEEGVGPVTLRATRAAFEALGLEPGEANETRHGGAQAEETGAATDAAAPKRKRRTGPRPDTKQAQLIAMLRRPKGATIAQVVEATGWQPHTVRGAIAGALKKKLGLNVTSEKVEGRGRVYRIG